ncbi:MAG: TIGR03557 family F420-dependent LLM class oxidoreductase [Thermomicrobiales bacterium]
MVNYGYTLSSEEQSPLDSVKYAVRAEELGFEFLSISDHFHPWVPDQPHSPFVWATIGGVAMQTERIRLGTGVTCPTFRIHPALVAQAAATCQYMMQGRFYLGLGTGENLNEHIIGQGWPAYDIRSDMLEEAIEIIRLLWEGGEQSYYGDYFTLENARIFTMPEEIPQLHLAAGGPKAAEFAGEFGDGLISTSPDGKLVETFVESGGESKPRYGQLTLCWAETKEKAIQTVMKAWPNAGLRGELSQELPTPTHFEQAVQLVREEDIEQAIVCGPDPEPVIQKVQEYIDAGFDHIYLHQVGSDQEGFFAFYQRELQSALPGRMDNSGSDQRGRAA